MAEGSREAWLAVVAADEAYATARMKLFEGDIETELREAFSHPRWRAAALRVLRDAPLDLVQRLLDQVFNETQRLHGRPDLAREVLRRLDPAAVKEALVPMVAQRLPAALLDEEDFRLLAEALQAIEQGDILAFTLQRAADSSDEGVRDALSDYVPNGEGRR